MNLKTELVNCVKALYTLGLYTAMSGNHSVKFERIWMWITPSEVPRYKMRSRALIKVNMKTKMLTGKHESIREWVIHTKIYENTDANAIVHCHSPYTLGISTSSRFEEVIEEAKIIVGDPVIIENIPSVPLI